MSRPHPVLLGLSVALGACGARSGLDVGSLDASQDQPVVDASAAPDVSAPDVSAPADVAAEADVSPGEDAAPCSYQVVGDVYGQVTYFASGASLAAGRYTLTYVDGCMKYSGAQGWTVNAYPQASSSDEWYLVGAGGVKGGYPEPPGTVGIVPGQGAYATFDECVAASLASPPVALALPGGPLGVWLQDDPYSDNVAGVGGRNPTWRLDCAR